MNRHITVSRNSGGRDFIVGDLHGCYDMLMHHLRQVDFDQRLDRLFCVGDLIDRGTQNIECLELIEHDWFYTVFGNHEDMFCAVFEALDNGGNSEQAMANYFQNGGIWVADHHIDVLREWAAKLLKIPLSITLETECGPVGITHAEPPEDWSKVSEMKEVDMIWSRRWVRGEYNIRVAGVWKTYHGHTVLDQPEIFGNAHFIDTGAVFTGNLTLEQIC